jgi:hypothetical protein
MDKSQMKPVEKTDEDVSGALVNTRNKNGSVALAVNQINSFEQAEALADWIAQSPVFNKGFKEQVQKEDGTNELVVNKSAIVTCLLLGNELGFTPMVSVTFGKTLDRDAAIKVERGRSMGLNPMAAMQNIYVFNTSQTEIVYTGIHVVNKVLTDAGVKRKILEDGTKPFYIYRYCKKELANELVDYNKETKDDFVVINDGHTADYIDEQVQEGKIPIIRYATRRALVELTRGDESIAIPYTLQQAIDAGLYVGTKSDGTESKGKANWNIYPETHLIKMSIMLGGRIIASDKLNGIYVDSELHQAVSITNHQAEDTEFEEVPVTK